VKQDLQATAGFRLRFDPDTLQLEADDGLTFNCTSRSIADLKDVLISPESMPPETLLYSMHELDGAPEAERQALARLGLTYALVLLPPLRVGAEFVKTHGHYHPPMPGTHQAFPEVYTQLYGTLHLLLQKLDPEDPDRVVDCALAQMTPGYVITIPPGYAHVLINASQEPALMAGLYGKAFKPDYSQVRAKRGLAYYLVAQDGQTTILRNDHYTNPPPLQRLERVEGTPFEPPNPGLPVWRSFSANPDAYAFLTQPEAASKRFSGAVVNAG